jgi:hypothetical protein
MANGSVAAAVRWDDGLHAGGLERVADGVTIVGFVSNDRIAFDALQHRLGGKAFMHLTAGQKTETQRPPK